MGEFQLVIGIGDRVSKANGPGRGAKSLAGIYSEEDLAEKGAARPSFTHSAHAIILHMDKEKGFTIIEVMIVLAIASLILLIVFLAIPALQRNSRNTQRKNDVSLAIGAVQEYVSNHDGSLPNSCIGGQSGCFINDLPMTMFPRNNAGTAFTNVSPVSADLLEARDSDRLQMTVGAKCNQDGSATTTGASRRSIVALYGVEAAGGSTPICQEF